MPFAHGHALVIGVGTYEHLPHLNVPITCRDAEQVEQVLRDPLRCGYPGDQVRVLTREQATRQAILDELDALAAVKPTDTVLLFYAGHGEYDERGWYCLTTHDTRMAGGKVVEGSGIRQDELLQRVKTIPASRMLLIVNACHAGAAAPGSLGSTGDQGEPPEGPDPGQPTGQPLPADLAGALLGAGNGRFVITACREEQKSYFRLGESTPMTTFTDKLVAALSGQDVHPRRGTIGVFDLYLSVHDAVRDEVQEAFALVQEPELTASKAVGSMAVALYPGQVQQGELGAGDRPATLSGAARLLDAEESARLYERAISVQIEQVGDRTTIVDRGAQLAGRDLTNVRNDFRYSFGAVTGSTGTVNQEFNVGDPRDRAAGDDQPAASPVTVGRARDPGSSPPIRNTTGGTLAAVLAKVQQAESQAADSELPEVAFDLRQIAAILEAAEQAEQGGNPGRRASLLGRAARDLADLVEQAPWLRYLKVELDRVR